MGLIWWRTVWGILSFSAFCGALFLLWRGIKFRMAAETVNDKRRALALLAMAWAFAVGCGGGAFGRFFDFTTEAPFSWRDITGPLFVASALTAMYFAAGVRLPSEKSET